MNKTLHLSIASALLALSACNSDKPEVIDRGPQDPLGDQLNNAAPVALPPSVKVSKTYRCGDGITPEIVAEHGLSPEEYDRVLKALGREPNLTELGIFSVMWSEHCSYKSSRIHLKKLPTEGPQVICGPGENAGVVDIGDGQAAIFKMESHNHPSYIEPYQGAATGVGGILRDVFTMGARPIANMNALRFGRPDHPKMRTWSAASSGIGGYGNCVGVPTVGGEVNFHPAYDGNILVNAMTVGLADTDKIFYSAASGVGNARSSMSAPRPDATASTARPWPPPSSTTDSRKSARPCRSATPSPKSC
jgi:hypothetical protein